MSTIIFDPTASDTLLFDPTVSDILVWSVGVPLQQIEDTVFVVAKVDSDVC